RVINLNLLPQITNVSLDYKQYSNGVCFDSGLVGMYLVNIEKKNEKYSFVKAYLKFLRTFARLETRNIFQTEIPGLIFLIREVFPHLHTWRFQDEQERNHIYQEIMAFFCDILDGSVKCNQKSILRDICVISLLNLENGLVLLRFIALGNPYLQLLMEMESNWIAPSANTILPLVRFSMKN
uniref:Nucleoporin Nup188 N-terminal subdomain III domain-containing protein n=1 Tax=Megaselia scalaris TaxID=36166 RepID=T1GGY7_MEGSC